MGSRGGQQECSVHGKMRSYINLIPDGTQGGMRCAPGMECKVAGVPNGGGLVCSAHGKTRSIDALVDDGNGGMRCGQHALCKVGTLCTVHGKLRNPDGMVDDGAGGKRCGPNSLCKTGPSQGGDDDGARKRPNLKRALCKYFEAGKCTKLDLCCFAHGEGELGQPIPEAALAMGPSQTNAATKWAASLGATVNAQLGVGSFGGMDMMGQMDALTMMSMGGMGMAGLDPAMLASMGMGMPGMGVPAVGYGADGKQALEWSEDWEGKNSYGKVAGRGSTVQGVCMLHNKTRTMSCLVEQNDGTVICKATHECKVVPKAATNPPPGPPSTPPPATQSTGGYGDGGGDGWNSGYGGWHQDMSYLTADDLFMLNAGGGYGGEDYGTQHRAEFDDWRARPY